MAKDGVTLPQDVRRALSAFRKYGTKIDAARHIGISASRLSRLLAKAESLGVMPDGSIQGRTGKPVPRKTKRVGKGSIRRYILTSAQNNTHIYVPVWQNLLALADHYDAELMVGTFSYDKAAFGSRSVKRGTEASAEDTGAVWYDPQVEPYIADEAVQLAEGLVWCGEVNILPTAIDPLTGLETYTGRRSGIFPHAKFALSSVASGKREAVKFNYTTGTVTLRNYIQKKAGLVAENEHGYGALLVEVTGDGSWFVRQLQATPEGAIRDLDLLATAGSVSMGHPVEAVTWGDVHARMLDPEIAELAWGKGGMLDVLRPKFQFIHDVIDFRSRNHHELKNPHKMFRRHIEQAESVEGELQEAADLLHTIGRDWCETLVVDSNHDRALERWLSEADHRTDHVNALFYLEANLELYRAMARRETDFHVLEWSLRRAKCPEGVQFLREDESFVICKDGDDDGIECGMHGHLGINGRPGSLKAFSRLGRRANTAHSHTAGIYRGSFQAGTSSLLDLGYNRGPSSWSHSHIVTYPEGTRTIVTAWRGKWRA